MNVTVEVSFSFKSDLVDHPVILALAGGADVMAALHALVTKYPQVSSRIFTDNGDVHPLYKCAQEWGKCQIPAWL